MNKIDEMNLEMRKDPNVLIKISQELYPEIISGDEERSNNVLIRMNEKLIETISNSIQPMLIINQELNKRRLVASENLLPKVDEYKIIANQYTDEFQTALNQMKFSTAFKAASGLSTSAILATFYKSLRENEQCKPLLVSKAEYSKLVDFIANSFQQDFR